MMTSQILKFANSWKTQKSKYLENETQYFPPVNKLQRRGYIIAKKQFFSEGNL